MENSRISLFDMILYSFLGVLLTYFTGMLTQGVINILPPYGYVFRCAIYAYSIYFFTKHLAGNINMTLADCRITKPDFSVFGIGIVFILLLFFVKASTLGQHGSWHFHMKTWKEMEDEILYLLFYTGLCSGIVEEMMFRGYITKISEKYWGKFKGMLWSGLLFGMMHIVSPGRSYIFGQLLYYVSMSILLTSITYRNNSIWDGVLVHAAYDILIMQNKIFSVDVQGHSDALFGYVLSGSVQYPLAELNMTQKYVIYSVFFLSIAYIIKIFPGRRKRD